MRVHTGTVVDSLRLDDEGVTATLRGPAGASEVHIEHVISAVGIEANTEGLGLEGTGVELNRGHVVVGPSLETGEPGAYAIGNLTAPPWLAHKASHEAVICVEKESPGSRTWRRWMRTAFRRAPMRIRRWPASA